MANGTALKDVYDLIRDNENAASQRHVQIVERLATLEGYGHRSPCAALRDHIGTGEADRRTSKRVVVEGIVQIAVGVVIALLLFRLKL